jgi:hypothetical protein
VVLRFGCLRQSVRCGKRVNPEICHDLTQVVRVPRSRQLHLELPRKSPTVRAGKKEGRGSRFFVAQNQSLTRLRRALIPLDVPAELYGWLTSLSSHFSPGAALPVGIEWQGSHSTHDYESRNKVRFGDISAGRVSSQGTISGRHYIVE